MSGTVVLRLICSREQRKYNNFYDELVKRREDLADEDMSTSRDALLRARDIDVSHRQLYLLNL